MKKGLLLCLFIFSLLIIIGCSNDDVGTSFAVDATTALDDMMRVYVEYVETPIEERDERTFYDDFLYDLTVAMLDFGQKYKPGNYDLSKKEMKILSDMLELKEAMLEEDDVKVDEIYVRINKALGYDL